MSEQHFEDFIGLQEADNSRGGIQGAGGGEVFRGVRPQAAIAGAIGSIEEGDLAFEAGDRAINPRGMRRHAGGIDDFASFQVVGSIDDDVEIFDEGGSISGVKALIKDFEVQVRAQCLKPISSAPCFGEVKAGGTVEDLSGQVREVHNIRIHQPQFSDACGRQIECDGGAQAAQADDEHTCVFEQGLALDAYFREFDVFFEALQVLLTQARLTGIALGYPLSQTAPEGGDIVKAHVMEDLGCEDGAHFARAIEDQSVFRFDQGLNAYFQAAAWEHNGACDFASVVFVGFSEIDQLNFGVFLRELAEQFRGVNEGNGLPRLLKELFKHR